MPPWTSYARYGRKVIYYGSVRVSRDKAPMRISFIHIPDAGQEGDRGLGGGDKGRRPIPFAIWGVKRQCQSAGGKNAGMRRCFYN